MKNVLNYISVLGLVLGFCSCESNLETTVYDASTAKAAVLENLPGTNYVLESRNSDNVAFTLKWTAPDLGYQAAATNNIEIDLADNGFAKARTIASLSNTTEQAVTVGDLNSAVLQILKSYGMEEDLSARNYEVRISTSISQAAASIYSNLLTINITPFSSDIQYPEIYVIGDYSGWGWDTAQSLFSFSEDEVNYEGLVDLGDKAANGFKITGATDWDHGNWGTDGNAVVPEAEAASVQLINDGGSGNISCYSHRFYRFAFSKDDLILKMTMSFDNLYLVGSDAGIGWDTTTGALMNFDSVKQRFYIDYTFAADAEIKFLTDTNVWLGDAGEGKLGDGGNIKVPVGNYRIYVNLSNSANQNYELNADDFGK